MMEKIMLVDGNSLINRAFYAMPLLTNRNGEYTNAVYGFMNIFFKLLDDEKPDRAVVCFDVHQPTFRHLEYSEYKGTRKGMPEELRPQVPLLKTMLAAMNITTCEMGGYEADDLLGTLAVKAAKEGLSPVIVSGDRDLLQLASDVIKIKIIKTKAGSTVTEDYFDKNVAEVYGVSPTEFIDVKALMGDTSDNVPGVPSIGEKTAVKLIQAYKTVENTIKAAKETPAEVKPKKACENLVTYEEQALKSKWLVTIVTNAPIEVDLNDTVINDMFNTNAYEMFKNNEFKTLLNKFDAKSMLEVSEESNDFELIENVKSANDFMNGINPFEETAYSLIVENGVIKGIAVTTDEVTKVIRLNAEDVISVSREYFESDTPKIVHDAKTDFVMLKRLGINLNGIVFDTMLGAYILNSSQSTYEYNELAEEYLMQSYISEEGLLGKGRSKKTLDELDNNTFATFFGNKSKVTYSLKSVMDEKLEKDNQKELYYDIELPLIYVLADMELDGIAADRGELEEYGKKLTDKINELTADIYWLAGEEFNINSPKQLSHILFEKLGLKGGKKTKTGWSTAADVLEKLRYEDEIVDKVLTYRTYAKLKSTYADGLLAVLDKETGRIHSTFNQTITTTGRISSTEPNLQNIPIRLELGRELRKVFKPREGYVYVDADYSQIELRVLAHMANDEKLINAFKEGQDIHALTASQVFGVPFDEVTPLQRRNAKAVNFGMIYGIGAYSLSQDIGVSVKEAEKYMKGYFEKYPNIKQFMDDCVENAKKTTKAVTLFGRTRFIPELASSNFVQRSFGERAAMNMPVQGTAADIIKIAMVRVHDKLKGHKSRLILQVHDELLIEAHKDELEEVRNMLKEEMENAVKLNVPLEVDVHTGNNWYEAK
jgi:DNA polymerase-1